MLELTDRESPGTTGRSMMQGRFPPHTRPVSGTGPRPVPGCLPDERPPLGLCAPTFASDPPITMPSQRPVRDPLQRGAEVLVVRRGARNAIGPEVVEASPAPTFKGRSVDEAREMLERATKRALAPLAGA
jgi:hypothetical protein